MDKYEIRSYSSEESQDIASHLAVLLKPGDVVTLEGELGSGKTTFTKGIARGLNITRMITSPTFTIVKEYEGAIPLYHMDAYRLEHSEEDIGFSEYFNGVGLSVVEWATFIEDYLPKERLNVKINYIDEKTRNIQFEPNGNHYVDVVKKLVDEYASELG